MKPKDVAGSGLAECLNFNLRRTGRALAQLYDDELRGAGLRSTQFTLLASVAARQPSPMARLSAAVGMDRTTLTQNLKPLIRRGLVRIEQGSDRRVREVVLTESGRAKLAEAYPLWQRAQKRVRELLGSAAVRRMLSDLAEAGRLLRGP